MVSSKYSPRHIFRKKLELDYRLGQVNKDGISHEGDVSQCLFPDFGLNSPAPRVLRLKQPILLAHYATPGI